MELLKKDKWWIWLMLYLVGGSIAVFFLGALLNVYDKNEWYAKPINWILGVLFFIFPAMIMFSIFSIQIMTKVAAKLDVSGKEIYLSPYIWLILIIVPVFGWIGLSVLMGYLQIMILINLSKGNAEQYI